MAQFASRLIKALTGKFNKEAFPPVANPQADPNALYTSLQNIKTGYEVLTRTRGNVGDSALLVKEVDSLVNLLITELDNRYNFDTSGESSANDTLEAFIDDFENLLNQITDHMGNSAIHGGGGTTVEEGDTIINEIVEDAPHALFSTRHTDVKQGAAPISNQALIVDADGSGQFIPQYPTIWRGAWSIENIYFKGDQVEDQGWLMTCNDPLGTEERAAPVVTGLEEFIFVDVPVWTPTNSTGFVRMTMEIVMGPNICQQFRVWPVSVSPSVDHHFQVIIQRGGPDAIPVSKSYSNPVMVAGQWNTLQFADAPLTNGTVITINYLVVDVSTETTVGPFPYNYDGVSNNKQPNPGAWNVNQARSIVRVHRFDADGVDRSLSVGGSVPGSRFLFAVEGATENNQEYLQLGSPVLIGDVYEFESAITESAGTIKVGNRCAATEFRPTPQATDYVTFPNYFPAGDPSWGTCTTKLFIDGVDQGAPATTGYGMDIGSAPGIISDKWDYNNYSEVTPTL